VVSLESVENVSVIISLKHTVSGKYLVSSRQPVQVWHVHVNALNSGSVLCRAVTHRTTNQQIANDQQHTSLMGLHAY